MKNKGWIRLGVVLSVAWLVGSLSYATYEYRLESKKQSGIEWREYTESGEPGVLTTGIGYETFFTQCSQSEQAPATACFARLENIVLLAFGPIAASWILLWIIGYAIIWVYAGFSNKQI